MNRRDFLQREAEGVAMRKEYSVNWDFDFSQHEIDDILIADELRREGERRRADDEFDGYFKPEEE